jgi:Tol biopolymer transport system component
MSNIPKLLRAITVVAAAVCSMLATTTHAQTYLETFGQNRVQYRKFSWRYYDTKHFRVYHYDAAGRKLARYVAEQAENDISVVERKLGGQFPKRFNIIVYNSYDEYRQTNVGLKNDDHEQDNNAGGTVDLVGDKLVVYYTGVHTDLRRQLRSGMAHVVMERMIFGENFRQMVKNAVLLNLPAWTTSGFIAYLVDGWDADANSQWKNILEARPKANFHDLGEQYPELAGKAFWKFVFANYGDNNVKNLLYTMQLKTSLNQSTKMILGMKVTKAYDSCIAFYKSVYADDALRSEEPDSNKILIKIPVPKNNTEIRNIRVSPRGKDVAYVSWRDGEYKVYIQNTKDEQNKSLLLEGGALDYNEQPDPNYPLLAWSNNGYKLAIMYRKGTQTRLRIYDALKAKVLNYVIPKNRFDRVLGMAFMEEDDKLVFSATRRSQTDLFSFTIRGSRLTYITNDPWDDIEPFFISGGSRRGILFLSNRPKPNLDVPMEVNELPTGPMNVYFYDTKTKRRELLQCSHITDVTKGTITQPIQYGPDNFAYLYDSSGIRNKYVVVFGRDVHNMDSAIAIPVTNYPQNLISHQYTPASNQVADVLQSGKNYIVYYGKLNIPDVNEPVTLPHTTLGQPAPNLPASNTSFMDSAMDYYNVSDNHYEPLIKSGNTFQSEFGDEANNSNTDQTNNNTVVQKEDTVGPMMPDADEDTSTGPDSTYLKMRPKPYMLSFKPDFFSVKVDNSVLFTQYQSYQAGGGQYTNPSLGGMITVSLNDLMEDHRFTGGFRIPINFSGLTYFLQYQNFSRRVDWGLLFLHTETFQNYNVTYTDSSNRPILQKQQLGKVVTNMVQGSASYPFDRRRSVRMNLGLRQDVLNFKSEDTLSLTYDIPNKKQYWGLSRVEYVFDNTISPEINIRKGFRYKFFGEYLYGFNNGVGGGYNAGADFRYYTPLYKHITFGARLGYAHSGGKQKILYYLGGVDNWINPQYANYVPSSSSDTYAFQALATNLRGYEQNSFNGNNYGVVNTEIRVPILGTFLKRPVQSSILKNLQLIGFADAGSAWTGFVPNAENTARTYVFPTPYSTNPGQLNNVTLSLSVPGSKQFGLGYGAGLRTTLLGYFMRLDAAWNIDGRKKPIWYFSLGTDF